MKYFTIALMLLSIVVSAHAQLTQDDLNQIRLIVKEEIDPVKKDVAVMQGELQGIDNRFKDFNKRFDSVENRITNSTNLLIALIIAAVGVPQIIIAYRSRKDLKLENQVETLIHEVETLKQQRIQVP